MFLAVFFLIPCFFSFANVWSMWNIWRKSMWRPVDVPSFGVGIRWKLGSPSIWSPKINWSTMVAATWISGKILSQKRNGIIFCMCKKNRWNSKTVFVFLNMAIWKIVLCFFLVSKWRLWGTIWSLSLWRQWLDSALSETVKFVYSVVHAAP